MRLLLGHSHYSRQSPSRFLQLLFGSVGPLAQLNAGLLNIIGVKFQFVYTDSHGVPLGLQCEGVSQPDRLSYLLEPTTTSMKGFLPDAPASRCRCLAVNMPVLLIAVKAAALLPFDLLRIYPTFSTIRRAMQGIYDDGSVVSRSDSCYRTSCRSVGVGRRRRAAVPKLGSPFFRIAPSSLCTTITTCCPVTSVSIFRAIVFVSSVTTAKRTRKKLGHWLGGGRLVPASRSGRRVR